MTTSRLIATRAGAIEAYRAFQNSPRALLAFDTETTGLYVRTPHGDTPRTVQFSWAPWEEAVVFVVEDRWLQTIEAFFEEADEIVGHNVRFDIHAMASAGIRLYDDFYAETVHDTVWLARLYDERERAQLKPLAVRHIGADADDEQTKLKRLMTKNDWDWATVPIEHLVEYGGLDAIYTGKLFDFFFPQVDYAHDAYYREQRLSEVLFAMERKGLLMDVDLMERTKAKVEVATEEARLAIENLYPGLNPNAPAQLKKALATRGLDLENTQAATLKAHIEDELIRAILTYRESKKVLSTYLEPWGKLVTPEGRLHPSFNQLGAATGRFSMSDPNLQNVKRGSFLRNIFMAEEGHQIVVADWNQMELRLYAHFAEDENMRAAFLSGEDIYQQAADLLGVPRQIGKMVMLASVYGAGPVALKRQCIAQSYQFGNPEIVPELEGYDWQDLYEKFHAQYRIKALAAKTERAAWHRGLVGEAYVRTIGGRRQRPKLVLLPAVNGHRQRVEVYKDLSNSLVQGSSADLMKQALLDVADAGYGKYLRLTVHDEMVLEVPNEEVDEVKETIERLMTRNEFIPPLTVEAQSADRYGDAK